MIKDSSTTLTGRQQLDALNWAANQAGMSYGQFCTRLTPAGQDKAFADYEVLLKQREEAWKKAEEQQKRKKKVK